MSSAGGVHVAVHVVVEQCTLNFQNRFFRAVAGAGAGPVAVHWCGAVWEMKHSCLLAKEPQRWPPEEVVA